MIQPISRTVIAKAVEGAAFLVRNDMKDQALDLLWMIHQRLLADDELIALQILADEGIHPPVH